MMKRLTVLAPAWVALVVSAGLFAAGCRRRGYRRRSQKMPQENTSGDCGSGCSLQGDPGSLNIRRRWPRIFRAGPIHNERCAASAHAEIPGGSDVVSQGRGTRSSTRRGEIEHQDDRGHHTSMGVRYRNSQYRIGQGGPVDKRWRPWPAASVQFDAVDGSTRRQCLPRIELEEAMDQVVTIGLDIAKSVFRCMWMARAE